MHTLNKTLLASLIILGSTAVSQASIFEQFIDKKDGKLDASEWILENSVGFMPVPIVITEPAVGVGGGAALLFFSETEEQERRRKENPDVVSSDLPAVTGVAAAATNNGSKLVGAFHMNGWKNDSIRYTAALFGADFNLGYYAEPNAPKEEFNMKGIYFLQDVDFRIGDSNFFVGGNYTMMQSEVNFDIPGIIPGVDKLALDSNDASMGLKVTYDSLDNKFSATSGLKIGIEAKYHHEKLGGDFNYEDYHVFAHSYNKIGEKWIVALRGDVKAGSDGSPFYAKPFIDMRGIAAMRYQADNVGLGEVEVRYNIDERWTVLGFAGTGKAVDNDDSVSDSKWQSAQGAGFRYLMARQLGMRTGIDVAKGPEEWTVYLQMGGAW
jgi:hypothetical protein